MNLPSFLVEPLAILTAGKPQDAFVFTSPNRSRLVYGTFYSTTFRGAVVRSLPPSLHGLRFHDLRHTAAALMVNLAGADAYLVMKRMGHSSITVTYDRYAKLFPERDAEIIVGLGGWPEPCPGRPTAAQRRRRGDVLSRLAPLDLRRVRPS